MTSVGGQCSSTAGCAPFPGEARKKLLILRHGERVDFTFDSGHESWVQRCFDARGVYRRCNINMPRSLPQRKDGPAKFALDTPLTEIGYLQAKITGRALRDAGVTIDYIYASCALRCVQTAVGILKGMGMDGTSVRINIEPGLFEWCAWFRPNLPSWMAPNDFVQLGYGVNANYAPVVKTLALNNAETLADYYNRSHTVTRAIVNSLPEKCTVVLVAHGASLDTCTRQLCGQEPRPQAEFYTILHQTPYLACAAARLNWGSPLFKQPRYKQSFDVQWHCGKDKVILITGCDSGFGLEAALALHERGCTIFAGCLSVDSRGGLKLGQLHSDRMHVMQMDVTDQESVDAAAKVLERFCEINTCGLWGLYNNAGCAYAGEIEWCPQSVFEKSINLNLMGPIRVTKSVLHLIRRAKGRVVTITSGISLAPEPGRSAYAIPKAALEIMMDCLRYEMYKFGVSCHTIAPGNFTGQTGIFERLTAQFDAAISSADEIIMNEYGDEYLNAWKQRITQSYRSSSADAPISSVIDCIVHAMLAKTPRIRYNCKQWNFLLWNVLVCILPQQWTDQMQVFWQRKLPVPTSINGID